MSRLADRIFSECQPFRASLLDPGEWRTITRKHLEERAGRPLSHKESERRLVAASSLAREGEPVGIANFDQAALRGVPVFAADDVGRYVMALPRGTDFTDVVASMAPPFDKFFVEFQEVPNGLELHAWGALITAHERPEWVEQFEGDLGKPRWVLKLETFLEREKGKPFGPVAEHYAGLAEDGTWFRHAAGNVWWAGRPVTMTKEPPPEAVQDWGDRIAQLLFPVLLAISFLHCKNIKIRAEAPSEKLSRKYEKKHGRRLVRYHVLDIVPMRRILEQYRSSARSGLRRALHICRGHFKTFTADAPLLGRHTGTYWWDPQARGSRSAGVVIKDYRVTQPSSGKPTSRPMKTLPRQQDRFPLPKTLTLLVEHWQHTTEHRIGLRLSFKDWVGYQDPLARPSPSSTSPGRQRIRFSCVGLRACHPRTRSVSCVWRSAK